MKYLSKLKYIDVISILAMISLGWYSIFNSNTSEDFSPVRSSVYQIVGERGTCTGVMIADNRMLTAEHCQGMGSLKVNGLSATILKTDEKSDLMLLAVPVLCPCVPVASKKSEVDTKIVTVGYGLSRGQWLTEGRVQPILENPEYDFSPFMGVSTPVIFGNSGGPVVASVSGKYKVVGILSMLAGDALGGMFPYVVPHIAYASNADSINKLLKSSEKPVEAVINE